MWKNLHSQVRKTRFQPYRLLLFLLVILFHVFSINAKSPGWASVVTSLTDDFSPGQGGLAPGAGMAQDQQDQVGLNEELDYPHYSSWVSSGVYDVSPGSFNRSAKG